MPNRNEPPVIYGHCCVNQKIKTINLEPGFYQSVEYVSIEISVSGKHLNTKFLLSKLPRTLPV